MAGRVVILNGAPRSGKSTLARAVQDKVPGAWLHWGVDGFNATLPKTVLPGIGLRPGGERPDLEPVVRALFDAYGAALADFAGKGFDIVADLGLHRDYAEPFDPLIGLRQRLAHVPVLLVGIHCAIDIVMARRNADPRGGLYLGGDTVPEPVARWQTAVHEDKAYDLELDMGVLTPDEGAERIAERLISERPVPSPASA